MLRHALLIATSLLLGLALSIAIAWRVTMNPRRQVSVPAIAWPTATSNQYIMDTATHEFAWTEHTYATVDTLTITLQSVPLATAPIPTETTEFRGCDLIIDSTAGFPFRCVHHTQWYSRNPVGWTPIADRGFLTINALSSAPLPSTPLWRGLIADTAIYATLCWLALISVSTTRHYLRRRRNLCPTCAYNLQGLPPLSPCPECGRA